MIEACMNKIRITMHMASVALVVYLLAAVRDAKSAPLSGALGRSSTATPLELANVEQEPFASKRSFHRDWTELRFHYLHYIFVASSHSAFAASKRIFPCMEAVSVVKGAGYKNITT